MRSQYSMSKLHPVAPQPGYSLWTRGPEDELLPLLRGTGLVPYSPLGHGFLRFIFLDEDAARALFPE
ncbi:hypothetical protein [Nocardia gipuzkoensis]|uniref:hypothetical protein n=1 Tax=Nocardia gipuzkoensis TaxID=2749991 RepID=UPI0038CD8C21